MLNGKKVLALIPARGGSKGIKDKNILDIHGKPLIAYTIDAAKKSKYIDGIVITTDSERIASVAKQYGASVPFLRPEELASDRATTLEAVRHAIDSLKDDGYDILVLLQPTSPLRTEGDIDGALEKFYTHDYQSLVSVSPADDSPLLMRVIDTEGKMKKLMSDSSTVRRQDMPIIYRVNGSIYINLIEEIDKGTSFNDNIVPYVMEKSHSVDIDDYSDIVMMKYYLSGNLE